MTRLRVDPVLLTEAAKKAGWEVKVTKRPYRPVFCSPDGVRIVGPAAVHNHREWRLVFDQLGRRGVAVRGCLTSAPVHQPEQVERFIERSYDAGVTMDLVERALTECPIEPALLASSLRLDGQTLLQSHVTRACADLVAAGRAVATGRGFRLPSRQTQPARAVPQYRPVEPRPARSDPRAHAGPVMPYKRMPRKQTPDEIAHVARAWVEGKVFDADHCPPNIVASVFIPILFGGLKGYTSDQLTRLFVFGILGEDQDCLRSINGWPMFVECRVWRRSDAVRAYRMAQKMEQALKAVEAMA